MLTRVKQATKSLFTRHIGWMVDHPWLALLIAFGITAASVYAGSKLAIRSNIEDLFPEHTPNVILAKQARARMPGSSQIIVALASPDKEANIRFMTDLHDLLKADPEIDSIEFKRDISFFKKNAALFLPLEDLKELDRKLQKAIQKAVSDEFSLEEAEESDAPEPTDSFDDGFGDAKAAKPAPKPAKEAEKPYRDTFDDGFGDEEVANPGASRDAHSKEKPSAEKKGFDDGFGDEVEDGDSEAKPTEPKADTRQKAGHVGSSDATAAPAVGATADGQQEDDDFSFPTEEEIRKKYGIQNMSEYLMGADGTVIAIKIFPTFSPGQVDKAKGLLARIDQAIASLNPTSYHPEMAYEMEGDYHSKIAEIGVITSDLTLATLLSLAFVTLMVALYFGNLRSIIIVMIPILGGMAWTMGLAYLAIGYLNLITAFIFAILFGLGVDYAIHVTNRYQEERMAGREPRGAILYAFLNLGRPMASAALTTTVAFLCLVLFDFRGFSQFGFMAGMGVPVSLFCVYMFFPGLTTVLNKFMKEKPPKRNIWAMGTPKIFGTRKGAWITMGALAVLMLVYVPGIQHVKFEHDMKRVMTDHKALKGPDTVKVMSRYRAAVESKSASPVVVLTDSLDETRKLHDFLETELAADKQLPEAQRKYSMLQEFASIFNTLPEQQAEKAELAAKMRERLTRKLKALKGKDQENAEKALPYLSPEPFQLTDLPDWIRKKFTDSEGQLGRFVLLYAAGNKADALVVGSIVDQIGSFTVDGKVFRSTASYYILKDAYDIVLKEGPIAMALAALLVLLIVLADFRRLRETIAGFVPLLLGLAIYLGFVGWDDFNINMFNMIILPTLFGMGVDTSIHLLHRIKEEGRQNMSSIASTTGAAAFMSGATTAVGFGTLSVATNPGLQSIGWLAPVGIMLCYLTSMLFTCSLMTLWNPRSETISEPAQSLKTN